MTKDVIYIDVDDDITAIVGKIKSSKHDNVALVPPKRVGILQSAVNLRLLSRQASNCKKHLSIISNNQALISLASSAKIPIAKNLQTEPEIPEIAALEIDDGEDIIDGVNLPLEDLERASGSVQPRTVNKDDALKGIDVEIDGDKTEMKTNKVSKNSKVPDFSRFRKKLFVGLAVLPLLIWGIVWMATYTPSATIFVTTNTSPAPVSLALKFGGDEPTNINENTVQTIVRTIEKDVSVEFDATGEKDLGEKASGSITIRNCDYPNGFTVPAGAQFTSSSGMVFVSLTAVSVPAFSSASASSCALSGSGSGQATVSVEAISNGEDYNLAALLYDIENIPNSAKVDAVGTEMTGGTTRIATVVSADDIAKATTALKDLPSDEEKQALIDQFVDGEFIVVDSFSVTHGDITSSPKVDEELKTDKAKLTSKTTYSLTAIARSEIESFIREAINKQITDAANQSISSDGIDDVVLSGYHKSDQSESVNIATVGQIGPKIDENTVKAMSKNKRYGDVQSDLESINGVTNVDVEFSDFWVTTVPDKDSNIQVEFKSAND